MERSFTAHLEDLGANRAGWTIDQGPQNIEPGSEGGFDHYGGDEIFKRLCCMSPDVLPFVLCS